MSHSGVGGRTSFIHYSMVFARTGPVSYSFLNSSRILSRKTKQIDVIIMVFTTGYC